MQIELGNHGPVANAIDDRPKITTIHVPEFDDGSNHPDGIPTGGYTHKPGAITVPDFKNHLADALLSAGPNQLPITRLPDHEALQSIVAAWRETGAGAQPAWVQATPDELTPAGNAADIEQFLSEFYGCPPASEYFATADPQELLVKKELSCWTRTPPGELPAGLPLPDATALFTDVGRTLQAHMYGGGQVGAVGQASASTATTLTTGSTYTTNQWAGYRVYATVSATSMVWGNVISNTNAANASVLTVDRWYSAATPGGAAGSTPSATATFIIADGGSVSAWFVGLTTTNITPAHGDTSLSGEYTTASGGYIRKIAPFALTSGVSPMSYTLTPVFTGNGSDTYPSTFFAIGVFCSMVVSDATDTMMFETSLNASATVNASGDAVTCTETVSGS